MNSKTKATLGTILFIVVPIIVITFIALEPETSLWVVNVVLGLVVLWALALIVGFIWVALRDYFELREAKKTGSIKQYTMDRIMKKIDNKK